MADDPGFPNPRPFDDSPLGRVLAKLERVSLGPTKVRRGMRLADLLGPGWVELRQAAVARLARVLGCEPTAGAVAGVWAGLLRRYDERGQGGPPPPDGPSPVTTPEAVASLREERHRSGRHIRHPQDTAARGWDRVEGEDESPPPPALADVWLDPEATAADVRRAWLANAVLDEGASEPRPMGRRELALGWHLR